MVEELKRKAEDLSRAVTDIQEVWLYYDVIVVVGGDRREILEHSKFDSYVGMCRDKTSLHDSVQSKGVLLYKR